MIKSTGSVLCYGHPCKDIDVFDKFAVVTVDETDAKPKRVPYDSLSWISPDWNEK
jgi:hypothetical protein